MAKAQHKFSVRVALGNGGHEQTVIIEAANVEDAKRAAEGQTGGKAKGAYQVS